MGARADLCAFADGVSDSRTDARERRRQELCHRRTRRVFQHRDQLTELNAVRMWFDFLRLYRKLFCRSPVRSRIAVRIDVMNGDVGIGDSRLFEILVHASPSPLIASLQFDSDSCLLY